MVARFLDGVEDVAALDHIAAPAAIPDVDARPWHIIDAAMADHNPRRHVYPDACRLFLNPPDQGDQAILHQAIRRVIIRLRPGFEVDLVQCLFLAVFKKRSGSAFGSPDECDPARARFLDAAFTYRHTPVVFVDKHRVAARLVDKTPLQGAILRAVKQERSAAVNRPVTAQQRFPG